MEQDDIWHSVAGWASGAAAAAYGIWLFVHKLTQRLRKEKMTSMDIGGSGPDIRFGARLEALERRDQERELKNDERHDQNLQNFTRLFEEIAEQRRTLGRIVSKLLGTS